MLIRHKRTVCLVSQAMEETIGRFAKEVRPSHLHLNIPVSSQKGYIRTPKHIPLHERKLGSWGTKRKVELLCTPLLSVSF